MSETINNGIPFVPENTIDPAAGLNISLNVVDALTQVNVVTLGETVPPAGVEGGRHIVGIGATGDWAGQDNKLARYLDGLWHFYDAYQVSLAGVIYTFDGSVWSSDSGSVAVAEHVAQADPHEQYALESDLGTAAYTDSADYATAAQGGLADSALQPGDNVSELTNDAGYVNASEASSAAPVQSVDGLTGSVDLSANYEQKRQNNLTATTDPTVTDDSSAGYEPLSRWINTITGEIWLCVSADVGAANWQQASLTIDELGSAALADIGTGAGQVPVKGDYDPSGSAADAQAYAVQRANHTGTQPLSTISDAGTAAAADVQTSPTDSTAGRVLTVGASPMILSVDPLRKAVESESGGRQTVIYTAKGEPCIMYVLPRFNLEDIPGWTAGTGTHPAFMFNGVAATEIFIGVHEASELNGEAVSQAGRTPWVNINYDNARAACQANGAGWDLMSIWDWAAVALWCMANGFEPRGNTNHGRHHDSKWETGVRQDGATYAPGDSSGIGNILTGSGPNTWRHDNSPAGISDLVGNVWEWLYGMKILDGVVQLAPDNGDYLEAEYTNTAFTLPSNRTWSTIDATGAPDSLKQALIVPNGVADPLGSLFINLTGERLPCRGGSRNSAGDAGLAAVNLIYGRTFAHSAIGFRPRYRPQ